MKKTTTGKPPVFRDATGIVHRQGDQKFYMSVCRGHFAQSEVEEMTLDTVVTCLWCVGEREGVGLRWFKWANER